MPTLNETITSIWWNDRPSRDYRSTHRQRRSLITHSGRPTNGFAVTSGPWDELTEQFTDLRHLWVEAISFHNESWVMPTWVEEGITDRTILRAVRQDLPTSGLLVMPASIDLSDEANLIYTVSGNGRWDQTVNVWEGRDNE